MDNIPKHKKQMSKDEVALLVDLIQSNPIITKKETNAATNKLKEEAWNSLTESFNAKSGSFARNTDQLKLKWDNIKKAFRKRAQEMYKAGSSKSTFRFFPPDKVLDKVAEILGSPSTGYKVSFGDGGPRQKVKWELLKKASRKRRQEILKKNKKKMSHDEVALLVDLIQRHPILTSKETNAATNKLKEKVWNSITESFNERCGLIPRHTDQLKMKWDNLKKAARKIDKEVNKADGKSDFIQSENILEKVVGLLDSTCAGSIDGDGGDGGDELVDVEESGDLGENEFQGEPGPDDAGSKDPDANEVLCSDENQVKKRKIHDIETLAKRNLFRMLKSQHISKGIKRDDGQIQRNLAITSYFEKKGEKLELEIKLLKMELARKENPYYAHI